MAKRLRREALWAGRIRQLPEALVEAADEYFPLPGEPLIYLPRARGIEVPGLGPPASSGISEPGRDPELDPATGIGTDPGREQG